MVTLNVIQVMEINQLFRSKGIDYKLHGNGGCATCTLDLECIGKQIPSEELVNMINEYLVNEPIKVVEISPYELVVKNRMSK